MTHVMVPDHLVDEIPVICEILETEVDIRDTAGSLTVVLKIVIL